MRIFLICPVRHASDEQAEAIAKYVNRQEGTEGNPVHWPARDTLQEGDPIGDRICEDNMRAMSISNEVHVWWDPYSQGSLFDLGMAYAFHKPIRLVNRDRLTPTEGKSFTNLLMKLDIGVPVKSVVGSWFPPYHVSHPEGHGMRSKDDIYFDATKGAGNQEMSDGKVRYIGIDLASKEGKP